MVTMKNLVVLFAILLSACAFAPNKKSIEGRLLTHIRADGTKLFLFTSVAHQRLPSMGGATPRRQNHAMQGRPSPPPDYRKRVKASIFNALEEKLVQTGYCREGFMPLGSFIELGQFEIRGECNEIATDKDKLLFPSNQMGQYH